VRRVYVPIQINASDPEAQGLLACYVASFGGMVNLLTQKPGVVTKASTSAITRPSANGTLDAYFSNGDQHNFGTQPVMNTGVDWTVVWESYLEGIGGAFDAYPGIAIFARGDGDPMRLGYSSDAAYDDIYFGTRSGGVGQQSFLLPSGITKVGQRHWGVIVQRNGTKACYVNGVECASTTCGSLAVITDDIRIGGTSGTTADWNGFIRQVRTYRRAWTREEAFRFWHPATRDALFSTDRAWQQFRAPPLVGGGGFKAAWAMGSTHMIGAGVH
jgi:hypothetical protein